MRRAAKTWMVAVGVLVGCSDRPLVDTPDEHGTSESGGGEGSRPTTQGAMFSACQASAECVPLDYCVFPGGEPGFCTEICPGDGPEGCEPGPGGSASPTCLDVGLPDGAQVCALDCSEGSCPGGMRCEEIATGNGARTICF